MSYFHGEAVNKRARERDETIGEDVGSRMDRVTTWVNALPSLETRPVHGISNTISFGTRSNEKRSKKRASAPNLPSHSSLPSLHHTPGRPPAHPIILWSTTRATGHGIDRKTPPVWSRLGCRASFLFVKLATYGAGPDFLSCLSLSLSLALFNSGKCSYFLSIIFLFFPSTSNLPFKSTRLTDFFLPTFSTCSFFFFLNSRLLHSTIRRRQFSSSLNVLLSCCLLFFSQMHPDRSTCYIGTAWR